MVNISSATFHCSAPDLDSCPDESLPEFAFIGRSNVGKSSLLNMLSGRPDLARVSATPGHTRLINMFTMNRTWRLVDLPGYGFAQGSRKSRSKFNRAVGDYLQRRPNLSCVFALIDSGLTPQEIDIEFLEWLVRRSVPFVLVFTKIDANPPATTRANIDAFTARISGWFEQLPAVYMCSATTGHGRRELLGVIEETLAAIQTEARAEYEPPPGDAASSPDVLPPSGRKGRAGAAHGKRPW